MFIRRILVPIDGTELTERAVASSLELARQLGAAIVAFIATPQPQPGAMASSGGFIDTELLGPDEITPERAVPLIEQFRAAAEAAGVSFEGVIDRVQRIDRAIVAAAESHDCDLILMVTHGRGVFGEFLFGSQTKAVLAGSHLPLLVLH